ncbi:hypothetical protein [Afipia felis]|uniref:Uncharacterized protein n=2 Tax=Afipia felis TaxID=1035 RepID=A0A380WD92_AFIFE|nr:hypothetical protein [Afipia felis]EKS29312.1 hypothetical protein HMPREF9697_01840 [Afipia felis ATCC 53690]SUU78020.1 Uncharacterised protein [Afipia felis]SUU86085.1 Uncharacterised protein [Afipia felis]
MTLSSRAIEAGARAIVAAEYDEEFYPFETSSKAEQQLALKQAEAFLAALAAEGMVLVPKDPTSAMLKAGARSYYDENSWQPSRIYRAMLSAHQEDEKSEGKDG